tara:strand:- start:4498 stop:5532 length:1035 start_codon:yes stop_codon:yes gene_type:complete
MDNFSALVRCKNIDLRSEREYAKGTIPGSVNIPILNNIEYDIVGKEYKKNGQDGAIKIGLELVKDTVKESRISKWMDHIKNHPGCHIFCYRGGLRSKIAKEWISENGIDISRLSGGYKHFRSFIIDQHSVNSEYIKNWKIIGGLTGSRKTILLNEFDESIDIENIANHRGSAFGSQATNQPSQADFENLLTVQYLSHNYNNLILEDESRTIGKVALPPQWYDKMQRSSIIVLNASIDERVNNIVQEYVLQPIDNMISKNDLLDKYLFSIQKIKKRLGDELFRSISTILHDSFSNDKIESHEDWISKILINYYDPMYKYKLEMRKKYIIHEGDYNSCLSFLQLDL